MINWQPIETFPFETAEYEQFYVVFSPTDRYAYIQEARYATPDNGSEPNICVWRDQDYGSPILIKAEGFTHWAEITPPPK